MIETAKMKDMRRESGSIDVVHLRNSDGITVESFPYSQLTEIEALAEQMTEYHGERYTAEVENLPVAMYPHLRGMGIKDLSCYGF